MNPQEASHVLEALSSAYPRHFRGTPKELDAQRRAYMLAWSDLDYEIVAEEVVAWIRDDHAFCPTPGQIRNEVVGRMLGTPDWGDAWEEVQDRIHRCGRYAVPRFSSKAVEMAVSRLGFVKMADTPEDQVATLRAQFRDVYQKCAEAERSTPDLSAALEEARQRRAAVAAHGPTERAFGPGRDVATLPALPPPPSQPIQSAVGPKKPITTPSPAIPVSDPNGAREHAAGMAARDEEAARNPRPFDQPSLVAWLARTPGWRDISPAIREKMIRSYAARHPEVGDVERLLLLAEQALAEAPLLMP